MLERGELKTRIYAVRSIVSWEVLAKTGATLVKVFLTHVAVEQYLSEFDGLLGVAKAHGVVLVGGGLVTMALLAALGSVAGSVGWAVRDRAAREAEIAEERANRESELTREREARRAKSVGQVELILADVDRLTWEQAEHSSPGLRSPDTLVR